MDNTKTLEMVAQELQNRIGQLTSNYETQIALLKAQAMQEIEALNDQISKLTEESNGKDKPTK